MSPRLRAELDPALHGVAVYNPDLLSRDELKRYFVARQPLLGRILADLRRERPGAIGQHRLILGQRGMGKTSLLRRLAVAVDEDPQLSAHWLALTFPEEQYNIANLRDLWLNCLDALGDALERAGRDAETEHLDARIEGLADADAETVLAALLAQSDALGRRLLLLFDNADLILGRLKDQDWALRETLQSCPQLLVFAASATAIEASYRYDAAFYDFFRIDELKGLTEAELRATLTRLAELGNTPAVADLVQRDPARIRTLHTLTGGNPRTAVLLYGVLAQGIDGGDVRSDLEGLLDRVTPLYKARFEELPEQGQRLVDALALHWDPITARGLADRLGWEVNLASAQLKRLQDQGVVEKTAPFQGKRALFQIAERFFNIWYLMRASRRVRRRLSWLVRFLRVFYTPAELRSRARTQLGLAGRRHAERQAEYSLALAQCVDDAPLRSALENQGLRGLVDNGETRRRLAELLDLRGADAPLANRAERMAALARAREHIGAALAASGIDVDRETFVVRLLGSPSLSAAEKAAIGADAAAMDPERWRALDSQLTEEHERLHRRFGIDPTPLFTAIADGDMADGKDTDGAAAAAERLSDPDVPAMAWLLLGEPKPADAEAVVAALEASRIDTGEAWFLRAYVLNEHLKRASEAEQAYRRAIEIDPGFAYPWNNLGNLLADHLARYDEAEQAYRRAIEIDPEYAAPWNNLGILLAGHLARYDEAEQAYRRAIEIDPGFAWPWNNLGILLADPLARYDEAEQAYRRAIEIDPDNADPWNNLGSLLQDHLARYDEAEQAYRRAIEIDGNESDGYNALAWLLYQRDGDLTEARAMAERAVELAPNDLYPLHTLATIVTRLDDWPAAAPLIRRLVDEADDALLEAIWEDVLALFREAVHNGRAAEARGLLDAGAAGERWRPLREALAAAAAGSADYLRQVAPEVSAPAREIHALLTANPRQASA